MLKIKLLLSEKRYASVAKELIDSGHVIDDEAELLLTERQNHPDHLMAKDAGTHVRLALSQVTFIESLGHDIVAHSDGKSYRLSERLVRLQTILNPADFLRVSNSAIVNVHHIRTIKPALSAKFLLTLSDGATVDVTRSYYYSFKEFFHL